MAWKDYINIVNLQKVFDYLFVIVIKFSNMYVTVLYIATKSTVGLYDLAIKIG